MLKFQVKWGERWYERSLNNKYVTSDKKCTTENLEWKIWVIFQPAWTILENNRKFTVDMAGYYQTLLWMIYSYIITVI